MKPLDALLLGAAFVLVLVVGYRTGIVKWNAKFLIGIAPTIVIAGILLYVNCRIGGLQKATAGVTTGSSMLVSFFPMILLAFWAMGEGMNLIRAFQPQVMDALKGGRGLVGSILSAFAMPGSIMGLPIVKELWEDGATKEPLLLFLVTSSLINWQLILFRQPMLGWTITAVSFLASLSISILLLLITWGWMVTRP